MQVELLIRAHDCHTLCCNTEGICNVLRACRDCCNVLQLAGEFNHLVRVMGVWGEGKGKKEWSLCHGVNIDMTLIHYTVKQGIVMY